MQMDFKVDGVDEDNFEDIKPHFKAGLSESVGVDASLITLSLLPVAARRRLTNRKIKAEIGSDSKEQADILTTEIIGKG